MTTPFCDDCIKLVRHEGTPLGLFAFNSWLCSQRLTKPLTLGTIETIAGVPTYVSKPVGEYAKDKAVIIVTGEQVIDRPRHIQLSVLRPV